MNNAIINRRSSPEKFSVREIDGNLYVSGYAAVFNKRSRLIAEGGKVFYEYINPNAFEEVLNKEDLNCVANRDHDKTKLLARTTSKTLQLSVDDYGLKYEFAVPDTQLGRDTTELLNRGDLYESSFKFYVKPSDIRWFRDEEDGTLSREILKVYDLVDVAIVVDGAYAGTDVGVTARELEECNSELCAMEREKKLNQLKNYFTKIKNEFYE